MNLTQRKLVVVAISVSIVLLVADIYTPAVRLLTAVHQHAYPYLYLPLRAVTEEDITKQDEAIAVPILMYHGVRVRGEVGTNTNRKQFIAHMEMLKREGYETITVHEYNEFREGRFTLPPKPIIITFDDGRKDSYYTVDEILRKLGFRATIFIATVKANAHDPFYLSWDELKVMHKTGRWEIEAHGRHSHDEVRIDKEGTLGRYLTSRIYDPVLGLESIEDFESRIRSDYENGIVDIFANLGIDPKYYAVPLNDYGHVQNSNYDKAIDFNKELTKKYFTLAFIEVLEKNYLALETFYNYKDTHPFEIKRLEVKNMSAEQLKTALEKYAPSEPFVRFPEEEKSGNPFSRVQSLYGEFSTSTSKMIASTGNTLTVARVLFGDRGWQDYSLTVDVVRDTSREASILLYYTDEDNFLVVNWDDYSIDITERFDAMDTLLVEHRPRTTKSDSVRVHATIKDGLATINFDEVELLRNHPIKLERGAPGFGIWDEEGGAVAITSLLISPVP